MPKFPQLKAWHIRYRNHQIEVHESVDSVVWIAVKEIRKALPALRSDPQLSKDHKNGLVKIDDGPRYFFTEAALTAELTSMGSHDALHLLAALEKAVFYSARRKRGDAARTAPFVSQSVDFANTQPAVDDGHILMHWNKELVAAETIASEPPKPENKIPIERRRESSGETLVNIWQGKESLRRTVFLGGMGTGCWIFLCLMAMAAVMDMDTYTGIFMLRQWVVLLLILAMPVAGIWWSGIHTGHWQMGHGYRMMKRMPQKGCNSAVRR